MEKQNPELLYAELIKKIIAVYYDVYNEIGHGFLESVYSKAMFVALSNTGLSVQREVSIPVYFRGIDVGQFKADSELEVALLFNFGGPKPQFRRFIFANEKKKIRVHPRESAVGTS